MRKIGFVAVLLMLFFSSCETNKELELLQTLEGHTFVVNTAFFSSNADRALSASSDFSIKLWNIESGQCIETFKGHSGEVWSANFSPDETKIVSASQDATVKIWNANSGTCLKTLTGHNAVVKYAVFFPDGTKIVSGAKDGEIKIWNANTGSCISTLEVPYNYQVNHISFSQNGEKIIFSAEDGRVYLWDVIADSCILSWYAHSLGVKTAFYNSDENKIISAGGDGKVKIWDAERGTCLKTFTGEKYAIYSLNEDFIAVIVDDEICIYDVETEEKIQTLSGHGNFINSIMYSSDGKSIISASDDYTIKIWGELNADDIL